MPISQWNRSGGIPDFIRTLYNNILDRHPESEAVIDYYTRYTHSKGLASTIGAFFTSAEYRAKSMSTAATVEKLYISILGRDSEPGGRVYYIRKLNRGMGLWEAVEEFVGSAEYRQKVQTGTAPHPVFRPRTAPRPYWSKSETGISWELEPFAVNLATNLAL
jgi:hypothetical protein